MNLKICGTHEYSIRDISASLTDLGWPHLVYSATSNKRRGLKIKVGSGKTLVFVADTLRSVQERKGCIIVVDSCSALEQTNIPRIPPESDRPLELALQGLPNLWRTELEIKKPNVMDYVKKAVKPSFLTDVQTLLYRISNHGVRKEAQKVVIAYLNGKASKVTLAQTLKRNLATEPLWSLIHNQPQNVAALRSAVALNNQGQDIKAITKATGCSSFDVLYLVRSYEKGLNS